MHVSENLCKFLKEREDAINAHNFIMLIQDAMAWLSISDTATLISLLRKNATDYDGLTTKNIEQLKLQGFSTNKIFMWALIKLAIDDNVEYNTYYNDGNKCVALWDHFVTIEKQDFKFKISVQLSGLDNRQQWALIQKIEKFAAINKYPYDNLYNMVHIYVNNYITVIDFMIKVIDSDDFRKWANELRKI
mgnify:CR=1 FL=1